MSILRSSSFRVCKITKVALARTRRYDGRFQKPQKGVTKYLTGTRPRGRPRKKWEDGKDYRNKELNKLGDGQVELETEAGGSAFSCSEIGGSS